MSADFPAFHEYATKPDVPIAESVSRRMAEFKAQPLRKKMVAGLFSVLSVAGVGKGMNVIDNYRYDLTRIDDSEYRTPDTPIEKKLTAIAIATTGNKDLRVGCGDPTALTHFFAQGAYVSGESSRSRQETIVIDPKHCSLLENPHFAEGTDKFDQSDRLSARALVLFSHEIGHDISGHNESLATCAGEDIVLDIAEQLTGAIPDEEYQRVHIDSSFAELGDASYHQGPC